jgi:hypothetical protein
MKRLALDKGAEWCRILRAARPYLARGYICYEVSRIVGTSAPTLSRLVKKFGKLTDAELTPERLAPEKTGGRDCSWEFLLKDEGVRKKLLELYVATMGASSAAAANDRRTAKIASALRHFTYEPECPDKLKPRLLEGYQPTAFVSFLRGSVTPETEMAIRGPKHAQLYGASARRDWTCRLPNGDRFETPAAYTLSMDDMSENHPFYIDLPSTLNSQPSTILSRQGLYAIFAKHKFWQTVELVARVRESYRAEDILRTFYGICLAIGGVPPFVEFEQGVWKARMISGWKREGEWLVEEVVTRPGMAENEMATIASGLGLCGCKVSYKRSAHTKHIETHFNPLQTDIAVIARRFQHIGRYAGEYELPGKQLRRVRAGSHHPSELNFASQAELADCIAEAMRRSRLLPSGIPGKTREDAHWEDLQRVGLLPLNGRLFAACLPGDMRKTTLRNGYINAELRGHDYQFRDEKFAALGDGYELFYKIDETNPNAGIAVFNRTSQSNSANFQGWQPGEFMFVAPRELPGPKMELSSAPAGVEIYTVEERYGTGAVDRGDMGLRKQKSFVATQARHAPRPGQVGTRTASARDGRGNVVEVTNTPDHGSASAAASPRDIRHAAPAEALPPRPTTARPAELPYSLRKLLQEV